MSRELSAYEAVVFDMDGTIFDSEMLYYKAFNGALEEQGQSLSEAAYFKHLAGRTNSIAENYIYEHFLPHIDHPRLLERWPELLHHFTLQPIPLMPTIGTLLETLKKLNIPMAIGSSSNREEIHRFTETAQIDHYFSAIAAGDEVAHGKPDPAIFLLAAQRLGVAPEKCIVLEDSNAGVEAGFRAGMKVVLGKTHITPTLSSLENSLYTDNPCEITLQLLKQAIACS